MKHHLQILFIQTKQKSGKTFIVKAIAEAENEQEYKIDIVRVSTNTDLEFLKVNDIERQPDEIGGNTYTVTIGKNDISAAIEVQTIHKYANIRLGDNISEKHNAKGNVNCEDLRIKQFVVPIVVTAPDGKTIRTYNVILVRDENSYITGKILTENVNGEHISKITVYRTYEVDVENEKGEVFIETRTEMFKEEMTKQDGTFKIRMYVPGEDDPELLNSKYTLVVEKDGYLDYTVEGITIVEEESIDIGEYNLIAGDLVKTGEIEIDDLVSINDHFGITITSIEGEIDVNEKYDLNGDGVVNMLDRNIIKKNYGKTAEKIIWQELETKLQEKLL